MTRLRFNLWIVLAALAAAGALLAWQYRRLDPGRRLDARGAAVVRAMQAVPAETWVQTMRYESLRLRAWLVDLMNAHAPPLWNDILVGEYPREWARVLSLIDDADRKRDVTADPSASLEPQLRKLVTQLHGDANWSPPAEWDETFARIHLPEADPAALARIEALEPRAIISVRLDGGFDPPRLRTLGTNVDGAIEFATVGHPWDVDGVRARQGTIGESRYRMYNAEVPAPGGGVLKFTVLLPAGS